MTTTHGAKQKVESDKCTVVLVVIVGGGDGGCSRKASSDGGKRRVCSTIGKMIPFESGFFGRREMLRFGRAASSRDSNHARLKLISMKNWYLYFMGFLFEE